MLCKLVSYRGSSGDCGKSKGENWIEPYRGPELSDIRAAALNPIRTQKHQQPARIGA